MSEPDRNLLAETEAWIESCLNQYNQTKNVSQVVLMNDCLNRQINLGRVMKSFHDDLKMVRRTVIEIRNAVGIIEERSQRTIAIAKEVEQELAKLKEKQDVMGKWVKEKLGAKQNE